MSHSRRWIRLSAADDDDDDDSVLLRLTPSAAQEPRGTHGAHRGKKSDKRAQLLFRTN